jgi:hypothetical protein
MMLCTSRAQDDPLQLCVAAFTSAYITDPWVVDRALDPAPWTLQNLQAILHVMQRAIPSLAPILRSDLQGRILAELLIDAAEGLLRAVALREPWADWQAQRSGLKRVGSSATEAMRWARR